VLGSIIKCFVSVGCRLEFVTYFNGMYILTDTDVN